MEHHFSGGEKGPFEVPFWATKLKKMVLFVWKRYLFGSKRYLKKVLFKFQKWDFFIFKKGPFLKKKSSFLNNNIEFQKRVFQFWKVWLLHHLNDTSDNCGHWSIYQNRFFYEKKLRFLTDGSPFLSSPLPLPKILELVLILSLIFKKRTLISINTVFIFCSKLFLSFKYCIQFLIWQERLFSVKMWILND